MSDVGDCSRVWRVGVVEYQLNCACKVFAFFADHRVSTDSGGSGGGLSRLSGLLYRRHHHGEPRPGPWRVRLAVRDLQPSTSKRRRPPPPMSVPVQRTRRFRCVFDLGRCRRRLVPSSVTPASAAASDSRRPSSRLLVDDLDQSTADDATAAQPVHGGPLIVVKHFCKVSSLFPSPHRVFDKQVHT